MAPSEKADAQFRHDRVFRVLEAPRWFCLVPLQERERSFANQHLAEGVTDYSRNSEDFCPCL
jgi:hypothetical protein